MSPEDNYSNPPIPPDDNQFKKRLRLLLLLAIVLVVAMVAFAVLGHHKTPAKTTATTKNLSITSTVPSINNVTTLTTSMAIYFNQQIKANSAAVISSPSIVTATKVNGNTLAIALTPRTLVSTKKYTITIKSVSSLTGKQLIKQLSFTPSFTAPTISGSDALISIGLSTDQVNSLFSDISQYDPWAQNVTVDQSTIKHYLENPSDAWSPWAVSFSLNIDGINYNVVGSFNNTESIQVNISDPTTNQQLFTAGSPGSF